MDSPDEHEQWAELAYSSRGVVVPIFSYNLHEARGYNRLASMARGRYVGVGGWVGGRGWAADMQVCVCVGGAVWLMAGVCVCMGRGGGGAACVWRGGGGHQGQT